MALARSGSSARAPIGSFLSAVLVLGAYDASGQVVLLQPERAVAPGATIG